MRYAIVILLLVASCITPQPQTQAPQDSPLNHLGDGLIQAGSANRARAMQRTNCVSQRIGDQVYTQCQ